MRVGYLGPAGTFSHEALLAAADEDVEPIALPTIHDAVVAVDAGALPRALVPLENSLGGSVAATLDTLAHETPGVEIVGEVVHPIRHCLLARDELPDEHVEAVFSHPQGSAQCARYLRESLPWARVLATSSTAEAARTVVMEGHARSAALANRACAQLYGARVLHADVQDDPANETRFAWVARRAADGVSGVEGPGAGGAVGRWRTAIVFWGEGDEAPGWLVRCLAAFADREVNLTKLESRPRRRKLGHYMFFADLDGAATAVPLREALLALSVEVEHLHVLGSYPLR